MATHFAAFMKTKRTTSRKIVAMLGVYFLFLIAFLRDVTGLWPDLVALVI